MRRSDIPESYWKSLRLLAIHTVIGFDDEFTRLGNGMGERGETYDYYAALWRRVEMRARLEQPIPRFIHRPQMVWVGMARFLGTMLMSNADLLDFDCAVNAYSELKEEFGE